jgi:hypothetical protein
VRYLALAEAFVIAEAVTGIDPVTLTKASRLELLDSAQPGYGLGVAVTTGNAEVTEIAAELRSFVAR